MKKVKFWKKSKFSPERVTRLQKVSICHLKVVPIYFLEPEIYNFKLLYNHKKNKKHLPTPIIFSIKLLGNSYYVVQKELPWKCCEQVLWGVKGCLVKVLWKSCETMLLQHGRGWRFLGLFPKHHDFSRSGPPAGQHRQNLPSFISQKSRLFQGRGRPHGNIDKTDLRLFSKKIIDSQFFKRIVQFH